MVGISVALATGDGQDYLEQQLDSLLHQSHLPTELVVCDDASQDGTVNILEKFARRAPFLVRIFRNASRLGYRKNFLKASSLCGGELIAFCDQDDIWDAAKLERILKCFSEPGILLAFHNSTLVTGSGKPIRRIFGKRNKTVLPPLTLNPGTVIPGHTIVVRRDLTRLDAFHSLSLDPYAPGECMPHDQWYP